MRRGFSPKFKRESAQLVLDQNCTVMDATNVMNVDLSTMTRISTSIGLHELQRILSCNHGPYRGILHTLRAHEYNGGLPPN